jgi:signal transduction histidine kinase
VSTTGSGPPARRSVGLAGWTAVAAAGVTAAVVFLPFLSFAYRAPALHVALETADAIIALIVGYLVYGRFQLSRRMQELLLVLALVTVAVANLALTALPSALTLASGDEVNRWAALGARTLGTLLLLLAALVPPTVLVHRRTAVGLSAAVAAVVVAVGAGGVLFADLLPPTVDPSQPLGDSTRPLLVAHPVVLGVQAASAVCYAVAAVVFTRQSGRTGDELMRWVGAGCVLAAAARLHYLLYPSLYSEYVYTGDLLRLGFYVYMLVGAAREIRTYWELRTRTAVLEDRRRMARDLHDGLTQELAFISAQSQRLATHPEETALAERIGAAAGRAVDEARRAITALTRPVDEPFSQAVQRTADDMARRHDVKVVSDIDPAAQVDVARGEALLRIVAEAVRNAVRHGKATRIDLRLTADPLCLAVTDNGLGFDVDHQSRGFGLVSMRERAQGLGAVLHIESSPGEGTTVRVTWP